MDKGANRPTVRIDRFFAGPGARADQWYQLVELADSGLGLCRSSGVRGRVMRINGDGGVSRISRPQADDSITRRGCSQRRARDRNPCPTHNPCSCHAIVSPERGRLGVA